MFIMLYESLNGEIIPILSTETPEHFYRHINLGNIYNKKIEHIYKH